MDVLKKVPVREQAPDVRNKNFDEVCLGYNMEEAQEEATRCINCKNAQCIKGCPVSINIPGFSFHEVKEGNIEEAYKIISQSSALPAVCGRVCPQESQCEGKCIRGFKGEPISIGKLERFVADYAREHNIKPQPATERKARKLLLSVQVLQDLHVPEILLNSDMMLLYLKHFIRLAVFLYMVFLNSVFLSRQLLQVRLRM